MGKLCKRLSVFVFIAILSACFAAAALRDFNPKLYGKVWKGQWVDGGAFEGYQVLHFRRTFDLKEVPSLFPRARPEAIFSIGSLTQLILRRF